MTAATFTENLPTNDPSVERVLITVQDGYTYVSRKFYSGRLKAARFSFTADQDGDTNCTISGATVTINAAGVAANKAGLLEIFGLP